MAGWTAPLYALPDYDDARIKAAYLYQLPNFIESSLNNQDEGVSVCVLGDNPFRKFSEGNALGKFRLIQKKGQNDFRECEILYISDSESPELEHILSHIKQQPILTVSDIQKFAKYGGMVGFTEFNGSIRLEINTKALAAAKFTIDQHLLEVALHVY